MVSTNATFEVIQTIDRQVIVRGTYYGNKPNVFMALRHKFEDMCQQFHNHRVFVPVSTPHITEQPGQWIYLQVYEAIEDSIRVDELIDWIRDVAQRQFMTPQQYTKFCRKSVI